MNIFEHARNGGWSVIILSRRNTSNRAEKFRCVDSFLGGDYESVINISDVVEGTA